MVEARCLPNCNPLVYEPIPAETLMSVAQRLNGKAGGAVAQRPDFFHLFESQQVIPMTWYMARQVHIPKVGMISTENQDCKKN